MTTDFYVYSIFKRQDSGMYYSEFPVHPMAGEWQFALLSICSPGPAPPDPTTMYPADPSRAPRNAPPPSPSADDYVLISCPNFTGNYHILNDRQDATVIQSVYASRTQSTIFSPRRYVHFSGLHMPPRPTMIFHNHNYDRIDMPQSHFFVELHFRKIA